MNRFRRVLTRWEKKAENDEAMLHFSCGLIVWNKVLLRQAFNMIDPFFAIRYCRLQRRGVTLLPVNRHYGANAPGCRAARIYPVL
ncbi:hypothetical protein LU604_02345 [Erwinia tracheiphila]|uniref:hypothetical protein n=1 Tax=Erwinia tracheiphila TaxID=65700 RepID=UPI001F1CE8B7|nr:hypothetical protein [Erwinia tracheiphila]UIA85859.1 hypothetical protein LU604_02345 [Erwinia tracheiphila]